MADLAIKVSNLGKKYKIVKNSLPYKTFREDFFKLLLKPFRSMNETEELWALRNTTLEVSQGEMVGIIGPNGAGKSTFLKLLSRVIEPTEGQAELWGRIGALLEVGTGFHHELTGRENVFLSGSLLGMSKKSIQKRFDEIIDFAGIEHFIDTPVKRYSSGMFCRLAFSVMAHLEADILIVDEVLAVGDAVFQKKCLNKMEGVAQSGRTVLYVSHQLESIANFCSRGLLFVDGQVTQDGPVQDIINSYYALIRDQNLHGLRSRLDRHGSGQLRFVDAWIENGEGQKIDVLHSGKKYRFVLEYEVHSEKDLKDINISIIIKTPANTPIAELGLNLFNQSIDFPGKSKGVVVCEIEKLSLNNGVFYYDLIAQTKRIGIEPEDSISRAGQFSVEPGPFFEAGAAATRGVLMSIEHSWTHTS